MKLKLVWIGLLSFVAASSAVSYCYRYAPMSGYVIDIESGPPVEDKSCAEVKADLEAEEGEVPRCLENGHYDLFQCGGDECFCTDCAGLKIDDFEVFLRGDHEESQCACAREAHEFHRSRMVGVNHRCAPNGGHYKSYQCQGTGCFCTGKDGKYIKTEDPAARFLAWETEGKDEFCFTLQ